MGARDREREPPSVAHGAIVQQPAARSRRVSRYALCVRALHALALATGFMTMVTLAVLVVPQTARAYRDGVNGPDCSGCHGVGDQSVELATTPMAVDPGAVVAFAVTVRAPSSAVAGINVHVDQGTLRPVAGGGMKTIGLELTHLAPLAITSGTAVFRGEWVAPSDPGAVRFTISTVAANGDGRRGAGDGGALDTFDRVYGCESATFYRDADGDGHGSPDHPRIACAGMPPEDFVASDDDCDDLRVTTYGTAEELCNRRDDDCDALVDENIEPVVHYPDADGDGYYGRAERDSGETIFGCPDGGRWASLGGDCAPDDPDINPGQPEICNLLDDDCDGRADERVRPQCGIGWCRRDAWSCDAEDCDPGDPTPELCNLLDDDCDGPIDEESCPSGEVCQDFACVPASEARADAGVGGTDGHGGAGSASGGCNAARTSTPFFAVVAFAAVLSTLALRRRRRR